MNLNQSAISKIDHLVIRVDDLNHEKLIAMMKDTLGLPAAWQVNEQPGFASGGVFAGNVDLEIIHAGTIPGAVRACLLYGVVFERFGEFNQLLQDLQAIRNRGIDVLPSQYHFFNQGSLEPAWTNIFLKGLAENNIWKTLLFTYKKLIPDSAWLKLGEKTNSNSASMAKFVFNKVYPDEIFYTVKYEPHWKKANLDRESAQKELDSRNGGPLGLVGVKRVLVEVPDFDRARERWSRFLAPVQEIQTAIWEFDEGPGIALVPGKQHRLKGMIWSVRSLPEAARYLEGLGLLGKRDQAGIHIKLEAFPDLSIRLVD